MSIWTMVWQEITFRKMNFVLGLVGVAVAVGVLAGMMTSFDIHDSRSDMIVARREADTKTARAELAVDVSKAMQQLGYNATILPKNQPLGDFYAEDYAVKTMPESWASKLSETKGLADRYVPRLRRKITWSEKKWTVLIVGIGKEHILATTVSDSSALVESIESGHCIVGHELSAALNLGKGQKTTILGKPFVVAKCAKELGTKEDITIRMDLSDAQELLDLAGQINEIGLVEHRDNWGNLAELQSQVANILPECQAIEIGWQTSSRTHARDKVADEAEQALEHERQKRTVLRAERTNMLMKLVPLGSVLCAFWIGLLTYSNVRDRKQETGLLVAIGMPLGSVRMLFYAKALALGTIGGVLGFLFGASLAVGLEARTTDMPPMNGSTLAAILMFSIVLGLLVSLVGSWVPIRAATEADPAIVLQEE